MIAADHLATRHVAAWREMQRASPKLANPFLAPDFAMAVASVKGDVRVAVMHDGPEPAAFFPFERARLGVGRPVAAEVSDCQGVIYRPGATWDARELLGASGLAVLRFDSLIAGQEAFDSYVRRWVPSPVVDLERGYDAYVEQRRRISRSFRRSLAKQRAFEESAGDVGFELRSPDPEIFGLLCRWKSAQYRRTGRPDQFAKPWIRSLVRRLMETDDAGFSGLLSVLRVGERPIAIEASLTTPTVTALWVPAYDPKFAQYSPGIVLRRKIIEAVAARGVRCVDMAAHSSAHKELFKTGDLWVGEAVIARRSPQAMLHRLYHEPQRQLTRFVLDHERVRVVARRTRTRIGSARVRLAEARRGTGPPADQ